MELGEKYAWVSAEDASNSYSAGCVPRTLPSGSPCYFARPSPPKPVVAANAQVLRGLAIPVNDSLEYVEVAENHGLYADDHRKLADELRNLGVAVGEAVIPSIGSIEEIE